MRRVRRRHSSSSCSPASASPCHPRRPRSTPRDPKVVIIVGATHGATAGYRARRRPGLRRGDQVHLERGQGLQPERDLDEGQGGDRRAPRSSSTSATATAGRARIRTTRSTRPRTASGSTPTSGDGDYNNKYYGEPYVATARPRAGRDRHPQPPVLRVRATRSRATQSRPSHVARQRADNYAAGFLKAGAPGAVIADGHAGSESYIRVAVHDPPDDRAPVAHDARSRPATSSRSRRARTAGTTVYQDPNTPTSGFYRSLAVRVSAASPTDDVTGGPASTDVDSDQP